MENMCLMDLGLMHDQDLMVLHTFVDGLEEALYTFYSEFYSCILLCSLVYHLYIFFLGSCFWLVEHMICLCIYHGRLATFSC